MPPEDLNLRDFVGTKYDFFILRVTKTTVKSTILQLTIYGYNENGIHKVVETTFDSYFKTMYDAIKDVGFRPFTKAKWIFPIDVRESYIRVSPILS